jgi:hypothetical protein
VPIFGDAFRGRRDFFLNLSEPDRRRAARKAQGTGTITNDEAVPRLSISNVTSQKVTAGRSSRRLS